MTPRACQCGKIARMLNFMLGRICALVIEDDTYYIFYLTLPYFDDCLESDNEAPVITFRETSCPST